MPKPKKKRMTFKQRKFAKAYLENKGNGTQAAREAGYEGNDNVLAVTSNDNLRNPNIRSYIRDLMDDQGLTDEALLEPIREGLKANKVVSAVKTSKDADAGTTDFIEVPDHNVRLKSSELGFKLKRLLGVEIEEGRPIQNFMAILVQLRQGRFPSEKVSKNSILEHIPE